MYDQTKMNSLLVSSFPELKQAYDEYVSWNDGETTGSYLVYEDVFMPFIVESFVKQDQQRIQRIVSFIESLASSGDFDERNLITVTVIDNIRMYEFAEEFSNLLGPNSKKVYDSWDHE